jgi:hypothetical protein
MVYSCVGYFSTDTKRNEMNKASFLIEGDELANLETNWNGYGALPIPQKCIDDAKAFLNFDSDEWEIFPTGRESIQIEWEENNGEYWEIEIFTDKVGYLHMKDDEIITQKEYKTIKNLINSFKRMAKPSFLDKLERAIKQSNPGMK